MNDARLYRRDRCAQGLDQHCVNHVLALVYTAVLLVFGVHRRMTFGFVYKSFITAYNKVHAWICEKKAAYEAVLNYRPLGEAASTGKKFEQQVEGN